MKNPNDKIVTTTNLRRWALGTSRGVALVTALIVVLIAFMLIMSTLYLITGSTTMSGAGKRYATAQEAADGSVQVLKECIWLMNQSKPVDTLPVTVADGSNLVDAVFKEGTSGQYAATVKLTLPGTELSSAYEATVTVERLFTKTLPGGRIEFGRSAGSAGSTAIYYRIKATVSGKNDATKAESSCLYRYTG
jgi:Tfp pilus assembly protein PilX